MDDSPALVFLHGFTNSGESWRPVISALPQRYRVVALDIRGHGSAWPRTEVTLAAVLGDIASVDFDRFTLVGYSQGGRIALHAALALPRRIQALVLIGASPGIAEPRERERRREADERLADRIEHLTIEQFAAEWAQTPVLRGVPADVARAAHTDRLRSSTAGLAAALRGLGTGALPPLWDRLAELAMPVTLIAGEWDAKFQAVAEQMAARIPQARLQVVAQAGHAVHLEQPGAVAAQIRATLSG
ncbi:MAG: 2-succinyl-6-hydroxy-2,4-cyclohexadiene-1-carboxylate synthase [Solirubrobacteraceae bacterium]